MLHIVLPLKTSVYTHNETRVALEIVAVVAIELANINSGNLTITSTTVANSGGGDAGVVSRAAR